MDTQDYSNTGYPQEQSWVSTMQGGTGSFHLHVFVFWESNHMNYFTSFHTNIIFMSDTLKALFKWLLMRMLLSNEHGWGETATVLGQQMTLVDYEGRSSTQLSNDRGFYDHFLFLKFFYFLSDLIKKRLFSAYSLQSNVLGNLGGIKQAFMKTVFKVLAKCGDHCGMGWLESCLGSRGP